jgi:GDPmannose 4,6-dehydratase
MTGREKTALITGIAGQDGSYLAEFLLDLGYDVHGVVRRSSGASIARIRHVLDQIELHEADLVDTFSLSRVLRQVRPAEVYNLAAQTFVPTSYAEPILTAEVTGVGVARMLAAIAEVDPGVRFFQASSSEMFGRTGRGPKNESAPFCPRSPYAAAKAYGHWITVDYRERCGLFACCGILFNHESPRRGKEFVTRKITHGVASIKLGLEEELRLGNLNARRDWGFAGDYVRAMWAMLQQDKPDDFVIGTGCAYEVEHFVQAAFAHVGLDWRDYVTVDPRLFRAGEGDVLVADASKARRLLGWRPTVDFRQLVAMMVDADASLLARDECVPEESAVAA